MTPAPRTMQTKHVGPHQSEDCQDAKHKTDCEHVTITPIHTGSTHQVFVTPGREKEEEKYRCYLVTGIGSPNRIRAMNQSPTASISQTNSQFVAITYRLFGK